MADPKWKDVEPMVRAILRDELDDDADTGRYPASLLIPWWNNAQIRLATHKPQRKHVIYLPDSWQSKPGVIVNVPSQFYNHVGLFRDGQNTAVPRISLYQATFNAGVVGYYITENELVLTGVNARSVGRLLFFYNAYYAPVVNEHSRVEVPFWATEACAIYTALQAVTREAMDDSRYRKYISSEDAGNPTHNPFLGVARFLKERFYEIIQLHQDDDPEFDT